MRRNYVKKTATSGGRFNLRPFVTIAAWVLLPVGLIMVIGFIAKSLKLGDMFKGFRDLLKGGNQGGAAAVDTAEKAQMSLYEKYQANGYDVNAKQQILANRLYAAINEANLVRGLFTTTLSHQQSVDFMAILTDPNADDGSSSWQVGLSGVFLAYGVRSVNNRQSALLGFLWDETTGNLLDHIGRYVNDDVGTGKTGIIRDIQAALDYACK